MAKSVIDVAKEYYQLDLTIDDVRAVWGMPYLDLLAKLFQYKEPAEKIAAKYESQVGNYPIDFFPEVESTLKQLKETYKLGVLTSSAKNVIAPDFDKIDINIEDFTIFQGAEDSEYHKPDPRVFDNTEQILSGYGIELAESVYVGDALRDMEAATDAGMKYIAVLTGAVSETEFEKYRVPIAKQFSDIPSIISGLSSI